MNRKFEGHGKFEGHKPYFRLLLEGLWHASPEFPGDIVRESTDGKAIASAYRDYGTPLSKIAGHLGVHYSTVSRSWDGTRLGRENCAYVALQDPTPATP